MRRPAPAMAPRAVLLAVLAGVAVPAARPAAAVLPVPGEAVADVGAAATGKQVNRACANDACVICPVGAVCELDGAAGGGNASEADPKHRELWKRCLRATMDQVGWVRGTCDRCRCRELTEAQRETLRPAFFTRSRLWYHLHVSKTGGTTFERLVRKRIGPMAGLTMCDEALGASFKLPFKHPTSAGQLDLFAPRDDLESAGCHFVSAEGRREQVGEQFSSPPGILTFLRDPTSRTVSQWVHDRHYNEAWEGRTITEAALEANASRDQELLRTVPKTLPEVYNNTQLMRMLKERYANWQFYRLCATPFPESPTADHPAFREVMSALSTFAFVGISHHYRTSLCLLAFQFHLQAEFSHCQTRSLEVYNAACYEGGDTNADCAEGQAFTNKFNVKSAAELRRDQRRAVPAHLRPAIQAHTALDQLLYTEASRIFWARVRVMEEVTGRRFDDMPARWRAVYGGKPRQRTITIQ